MIANNLAELMAQFTNPLKKVADYVTLQMVNEIKDIIEAYHIEDGIYNDFYEPTGEFKEAWVNEASTIIGNYVEGVMKYEANNDMYTGTYPYTHGTQGNKLMDDSLAEIINSGNWGDAFGDGGYRSPRPFWNDFISFANENFGRWIKEGCALYGVELANSSLIL